MALEIEAALSLLHLSSAAASAWSQVSEVVSSPSVLSRAAEQVPALAVLVWVVFYFLKHQERTIENGSMRLAELTKRYEELSSRNIELHDRVISLLGRLER